jgi:hypothetical protein
MAERANRVPLPRQDGPAVDGTEFYPSAARVSLITFAESLSSLSATNFVCLRCSAPVHSKNWIRATSSGRTQTHSFIFSAVSP